MADNPKLTVEQILAAARRQDGGSAASTPAKAEGAEASAKASHDQPASDPAPSAGKPSSQMSVAEMLAAARAEKSSAASTASTSSAKAEKPASGAGGPAKPAGQMSVAEMLAAARGEKAGGGATKPSAKPAADKPVEKKAPKPEKSAEAKPAAVAKPAASPSAAAGPKDTASILAAARQSSKPGPISKAEALAREPAAEATGAAAGKHGAKEKLAVPPMPAKPEYARRPEPAAAPQSTRRGFFAGVAGAVFGSSLAIGFSTLAATNLLWVLGGARFMFPNILTEPPTKFRVGFPTDLAPGQVEEKYKALFGVWIVRYEYEGQTQIYALKSVCTHLGCTPNWLEAEQKFKCPCHGSGFYKDGVNFEGPAPRPLERYAIRKTEDGQLEVDKSRTFLEEKGQWKDPASFVSV